MDLRKAKLLNVIVFSISIILLFFLAINIIEKNYFLATTDIILFFIVCIPSLLLQYKRKYIANLVFITSAFIFYTTIITILKYDFDRQTEHILPAISIMVVFIFDGWKKNLIFLVFPISFFTIRFTVMYQHFGFIEFQSLHLIYLIEFLIVFVIASYFKADMITFYNKLDLANQTKLKLLRIISHDLKNPFNSLLGTSELQSKFLESGNLEKLKTSTEIINLSSKKIYDLTKTLLDWSMIQSEILKANFEKINLTDVIKHVIDFSNINAVPKEIKIEFHPKEVIYCNCDNTMIQICLRNIITNAIKFSNRNSKIDIRQIQNKNKIKIEVQDYGIGINEEDINNILNKNTLSSSYGTENEIGTGLGIKISNELMQIQNGTISIKSKLNYGTTFTLSLPIINN